MYLIVFVFGLLIGSFLNVCIYRIPQGESIAFPPSHCSKCNHSLSVLDLFPVFSYLFLRGKCRYCKEKISIQYPMVELLTAVLFVLAYQQYGLSIDGAFVIVMIILLIIASVIDLNLKIIPNKINIIIAAVSIIYIIYKIVSGNRTVLDCLFGLLLGGGSLYLMGLIAGWILSREAMGGGDMKLMAACGMFLGFSHTLLAMLLAFYSAAFVLILMLIIKKLKRNNEIPFGPFLSAGVIGAILYYEPLYHILISSVYGH